MSRECAPPLINTFGDMRLGQNCRPTAMKSGSSEGRGGGSDRPCHALVCTRAIRSFVALPSWCHRKVVALALPFFVFHRGYICPNGLSQFRARGCDNRTMTPAFRPGFAGLSVLAPALSEQSDCAKH